MLRVGIVGCGRIADALASEIGRIGGSEIVGVCDREPLMARQLSDRFPVGGCYSDVADLIREARPDVIHVTTPPRSHFPIAKLALEQGCHVYVEKPFTIDEQEAKTLIDIAETTGLKLTAGHDDQFSHSARRMRTLVRSGYLGDGPVHMESTYCYPLTASGYAGAFLANREHWVNDLPGGLLQNIISHGIARIAEFLECESPEVTVYGFRSPLLRESGETGFVDELRVIISNPECVTAYFTFSSQMRPALHQFRIFGTRNGLVLDQDEETLIQLTGKTRVSYLQKFVPPIVMARQYCGNLLLSLRAFLSNDFHMKSGMKYLIQSFYRSIEEDTEVPIPYREILLTARIMDRIFDQLASKDLEIPEVRPDSMLSAHSP